jgi:hypothetical protein
LPLTFILPVVSQLFLEEFLEEGIFLVKGQTVPSVLPFGQVRRTDVPGPCLLAIHEQDGSQDHGTNIPTGSPRLFVVVSECGAYRFVDFKSAARSEEQQLRRREGIILSQLE